MRVLTKYKERTMKVDLYTKIVLTAIGLGLFLNVADNSKLSVVKDASADEGFTISSKTKLQ